MFRRPNDELRKSYENDKSEEDFPTKYHIAAKQAFLLNTFRKKTFFFFFFYTINKYFINIKLATILFPFCLL